MALQARVAIHSGTGENGQPLFIVNPGEKLPKDFPKDEIERLVDRGFVIDVKSDDDKDLAKLPLNAEDGSRPALPASTAE